MMDTRKVQLIHENVCNHCIYLGFVEEKEHTRPDEKPRRFRKVTDEYIDLITYGFGEKSPWVVGSIQMSRKILHIESVWEDMMEYLYRRIDFNSTVFSDSFNERPHEPVNAFKMEGVINDRWEEVSDFLINALDTHLIPDIEYKSDIHNLYQKLNNPFDKDVIGFDWIRKIIVAKFLDDPNLISIYDYVYNRFEKLNADGDKDPWNLKILYVLETVRERMGF